MRKNTFDITTGCENKTDSCFMRWKIEIVFSQVCRHDILDFISVSSNFKFLSRFRAKKFISHFKGGDFRRRQQINRQES